MLISLLFLVGGFIGLFLGAEWLVRGSASLARSTGVRPVIIALTIIAFGTSAPELFVSVSASAHGSSTVAIGNILGSMIANMGLILGLAALVRPIKIEFRLLKKEVPILLLCEFVFVLLAFNLRLSRIDGAIFLTGFVLFSWYCVKEAIHNIKDHKAALEDEFKKAVESRSKANGLNIFLILLGLALLLGCSQFVVQGAITLANFFNVPPYIIAASIVALGTSLPELAASVMAAARGESDIAVGNILGSNIFNILMCIGAAALVSPLTLEPKNLRIDAPIMIAISILLGIFMWTRRRIGRIEGSILVLTYIGYLFYLFTIQP